MSGDGTHRHIVAAAGDPGLQPERTAFAWTSTALAASGAAVAIGTVRRRQLCGARLVVTPPSGALVGVAAATLVASAGGVASVLIGRVA